MNKIGKTDLERYKERQEIFIEMLKEELGSDVNINKVRPIFSISDDWEIKIIKAGERKSHNIILSSELMTDENNDHIRKFKLQIWKLKRM